MVEDVPGAIEQNSPGALLLGEVWDTPKNSSSYVPDDST